MLIRPAEAQDDDGIWRVVEPTIRAGETYPLGGDLLATIDEAPLYSVDQLRDVIGGKKPGDNVKLRVYRGDQQRTVTVKLGRQPSTPGS